MNNKDVMILKKVIKYCEDIETLKKKYNNRFDVFQNDISFQYSVNMCIIQIGELVGRLSEETTQLYRNIPWREIRAMRNIHAHDYENVDLSIVWNTINEDIPLFVKQIQEIIKA